MSDNYCIGIDLGTTNTLCAVWRYGEPSPRILPITQPYDDLQANGFQRNEILPSAVAVLPEGIYVGFAARQLARLGQGYVVTSIKRYMGSHWSRKLGGTDWTPERISACILKAVQRELQMTFNGLPRQVIITVPASFGTEARRATLRAAWLAGFDPRVTRLFDEPAAALLFQWQRDLELSSIQVSRRIMMIDVGGGTTDVSLLELRKEGDTVIADIQGRSRYTELAGDDFDLNIAGLLLARFEAERGISVEHETVDARRKLYYELLLRAEEAKQRLALAGANARREKFMQVKDCIIISRTPDQVTWRTELSLQDMAIALQEFFPFSEDENARREEFSFFKPIQQCLDSAEQITGSRLVPDDIDIVYLAGGSSLLPMLSSAVRRILFQRPRIVDNPMQAVTLGAAWYAGVLEGYVNRQLLVRERLFDGLFLQTKQDGFVQILSPREIVPLSERDLDNVLATSQHDRRVEVSLFMGSVQDDADLVPLARRRVDFGTLLPEGQPICLTVSVSKNRQVELAFSTERDGKSIQGCVEVSAALGWEDESAWKSELPEVNQPLGGTVS